MELGNKENNEHRNKQKTLPDKKSSVLIDSTEILKNIFSPPNRNNGLLEEMSEQHYVAKVHVEKDKKKTIAKENLGEINPIMLLQTAAQSHAVEPSG